jgi:transposase
MAKRYVVTLSVEERKELEAFTSSGKSSRNKVVKAFILLKADEGEGGEGWTDKRIADAYNISVSTVEQTRERFIEGALNRRPTKRVYRRKIEGEEEAHLIVLACSDPPEGRAEWTMQLLADKMVELNYVESISDETVRRVLNRNELKPWQKKNGASRRSKTPPLSAKWKRFRPFTPGLTTPTALSFA